MLFGPTPILHKRKAWDRGYMYALLKQKLHSNTVAAIVHLQHPMICFDSCLSQVATAFTVASLCKSTKNKAPVPQVNCEFSYVAMASH